jgi:hypothetical protein
MDLHCFAIKAQHCRPDVVRVWASAIPSINWDLGLKKHMTINVLQLRLAVNVIPSVTCNKNLLYKLFALGSYLPLSVRSRIISRQQSLHLAISTLAVCVDSVDFNFCTQTNDETLSHSPPVMSSTPSMYWCSECKPVGTNWYHLTSSRVPPLSSALLAPSNPDLYIHFPPR